MAITIPSDLELLTDNQTSGYIPAGQDPLHTLMRRGNWHYATHAPACWNIAPMFVGGASNTIDIPVTPSADGLTYDATFTVYAASTGTVDLDVLEATSAAGPFTSVGAFPITTASITGGTVATITNDAPIAATTTFLRLRVNNGAGNVQMQGAMGTPKKLTSITAGEKSSGFIGYDDSALTATGAPIHTEYFHRLQDNINATYTDRVHILWSFTQQNPAREVFTNTGSISSSLIGMAAYEIPAIGDQDVTVYCRCADSGAGSGKVVVKQLDSPTDVVFDADDTDQSDTLTLNHHYPQVITASAVAPSGNMSPWYIIVEWTPPTPSPVPIIASPAPPPMREYLVGLDILSERACLTPYAGCGLCINTTYSLAANNYWYHLTQVGPGVIALMPRITISRTNGSGTGAQSEFYTTDDATWAILGECNQGGTESYLEDHAEVVNGAQYHNGSPTANQLRMANISPADREPKLQTVWGRYYMGWSHASVPIQPPSEIP